MARHRPNARAIKQHRSYTVEEAARCVGVEKGTVRRWMKEGLAALTDQKPFLILGPDLKAFLDKKARRKQTCHPHEFFCFRCRTPKAAAGRLIDYEPKTLLSGQLSAICETCGTIMHKNYSAAKLPALKRVAEVSFPRGEPRLSDGTKPRSNEHFGMEAKA